MKTSTKKPRIWDAVKSPIRKGDNTALKKVLVKFKEEGKWSEVRTGNVLSWIRKESLIRAGKGEQNLIHPELKNDLKKLNDLSRQEQCDKTKQILKEIDAHLKTGDYLFLQAVIKENKRDDGGRLVFPSSKLREAASVIKLLSPAFEGKTSDIVDLKKAGKERVQVLTQSFQDSPRIYNADAVALNVIYNVLAPAAKRYRENGKTISCEEILAQKGIAETKDSYWNLGIALLLVSGRRTCEIFGGNATFTPLSENPYALTFTGQAKTKTTTPLSYTILTLVEASLFVDALAWFRFLARCVTEKGGKNREKMTNFECNVWSSTNLKRRSNSFVCSKTSQLKVHDLRALYSFLCFNIFYDKNVIDNTEYKDSYVAAAFLGHTSMRPVLHYSNTIIHLCDKDAVKDCWKSYKEKVRPYAIFPLRLRQDNSPSDPSGGGHDEAHAIGA